MKEEVIMVSHQDMTKEATTILTIHGININGFRLSDNALPIIYTYSYPFDAKKIHTCNNEISHKELFDICG